MTQTERNDLVLRTTPGALAPAGEDPEVELALLERKAALAARMRDAIDQILIANTYPEDWSIQGAGKGARACLGSAGAERVGRLFQIEFEQVNVAREDFEDDAGKGYRYVVTGYARRGGLRVYAEGVYSTREDLLGKKDGQWRPLSEINENDIRNAARHTFGGNAIKAVLGVRNIPQSQYVAMMKAAGQDPGQSKAVDRGQGTQGGTPDQDRKHQNELAQICIQVANAGETVERNEAGEFERAPMGDGDDRPPLVRAQAICELLSEFPGRGGEMVKGLPASKLRGQRLVITLKEARKLVEPGEVGQ